MKKENQIQKPTPIGYISFCTYSLQGKAYTELNKGFNLRAKTYQGLIQKIKTVHNSYNTDSYIGTTELRGLTPTKYRKEPKHLEFESQYIFGPMVHYDIYIQKIFSEQLEDDNSIL